MKIKNSAQSVSPDAAVLLMCFAMLVACPLRIFQMLRNMDSITGFYNDSGSITIIILYAVLGVASLLILLFSYLSARIPAAIAPQGRRILLGIASFVFAATLFYDAISNYFSLGAESTATIVQNVRAVSLMQHLHAIFAFLSCCYFVVFCISYFSGKSFHKKLKILSLMPLAWAVVRVLERITVIISIVRVSELLLELCALVFLMIFLLSFARVVSEVNCKGSMWSVIGCGCVSAMLMLSYTIPRIMLMLTGNADSLVDGYPLNFCDMGCALFIIVFVVTSLRCGYVVEDVEAMQAEMEDAAAEEEEPEEEPEEEKTVGPETVTDGDGNVMFTKKNETAQEPTEEK